MEIDLPSLAEAAVAVRGASDSAVQKLISTAATKLGKSIKGPARSALVGFLAEIDGYSAYLKETHDRVSMVKTFVNPNKRVRLLDQYVSMRLEESEDIIISDSQLIERIVRPSRTVIQATAGFGKSVLMRYLAIQTYDNPTGRLPLFLELRDLNRLTTPNLLGYIHQTYKKDTKISQDVLTKGLETGAFILLFDGFDEINHDIRDDVEAQLLHLARTYKKTPIVVSGRPDEKFRSWRSFDTYQVSAMDKDQVITLISKLEFDEGTKERFIEKIKESLFVQHKSFLSTPLLATLMLLTYQKSANIPEKMHLFYENAYDALFDRHDALKEQFERKRKSGLRIDEFEKFLSVFCLETYVKQKIEFTKVDIIRSINAALAYTEYKVDPNAILFDMTESLCLMQKEGPSYSFIHRSFQEYFTALFLSRAKPDTRDQFIDEIAFRSYDNVLPMLFDMAKDQIEPSWVLRNSSKYLEDINQAPDRIDAAIMSRFTDLTIILRAGKADFFDLGFGEYSKFFSVMNRFYPKQMNFNNLRSLDYDNLTAMAVELMDNKEIRKSPGPKIRNFADNIELFVVVFGPELRPYFDRFGITKFVTEQLTAIEEICSLIDGSQEARSRFLDNLFLNRS